MRTEIVRLHARLETRHWWFRARREIVLRVLRAVHPPPSKDTVIVDVGCGTGANTAFLAQHYRCVGVDPGGTAIAAARRRYPDLDFICGRAPDDLPERTREAHVFLLMDVLEHVAEDRELLGRWVEAARPGARFLVTVPANPGLWSEHDVAHGHHRRYERDDVAHLLESATLESELLSSFNARLYPALWMVRKLARLTGRTTGPGGTDLRLPPKVVNEGLYHVFRGEADRLARALEHPGSGAYRRGLSLLALARKTRQRHRPTPAVGPEAP